METKDYCFSCPYTDCKFDFISECDFCQNKGKLPPKKEKHKLSEEEKRARNRECCRKYYLKRKERMKNGTLKS